MLLAHPQQVERTRGEVYGLLISTHNSNWKLLTGGEVGFLELQTVNQIKRHPLPSFFFRGDLAIAIFVVFHAIRLTPTGGDLFTLLKRNCHHYLIVRARKSFLVCSGSERREAATKITSAKLIFVWFWQAWLWKSFIFYVELKHCG